MNLKVKAKETVKGVDYSITAGKIYPAKHSEGYHYQILDDSGKVKYFCKSRFVEVQDSNTPASVDRKIIDKTLDIALEGCNVLQVATKLVPDEYGHKQLVMVIDLQEKSDE